MNAFPRPRRTFLPAGFTLVEMLIVLLVFMVICAAVFSIGMGVLQSASDLQDDQNHRDQIVALQAFLNKKLEEMPALSFLNSYVIGDVDDWTQSGIIFGRDDLELTAIDATAQPDDDSFTLRLATYTPDLTETQSIVPPRATFQASVMRGDPTLNWVPLLRGIKAIHWKFQDSAQADWKEVWSASTPLPSLIELSVQLADESQSADKPQWVIRNLRRRREQQAAQLANESQLADKSQWVILDFWLPRVQPPIYVFNPANSGIAPHAP